MLKRIKINMTKPTAFRTKKRISRFLISRNVKHYQAKGYDNWETMYFCIEKEEGKNQK